MLYNRDVVLPVDNILKPRRKYLGEDYHEIALQELHKSFVALRNNLKKAKVKQSRYADRGTKEVNYNLGDAVFCRNNQRKNEFVSKWRPYYRVVEKSGPVSYLIKDQLDGSTAKVHAESLRLANVTDWQISNKENNKQLRDAA